MGDFCHVVEPFGKSRCQKHEVAEGEVQAEVNTLIAFSPPLKKPFGEMLIELKAQTK